MTLKEAVRNRARHFLNPDVAAVADMTLAELQQFVGGTYTPSADQLQRLARRMGVEDQ